MCGGNFTFIIDYFYLIILTFTVNILFSRVSVINKLRYWTDIRFLFTFSHRNSLDDLANLLSLLNLLFKIVTWSQGKSKEDYLNFLYKRQDKLNQSICFFPYSLFCFIIPPNISFHALIPHTPIALSNIIIFTEFQAASAGA